MGEQRAGLAVPIAALRLVAVACWFVAGVAEVWVVALDAVGAYLGLSLIALVLLIAWPLAR
ncbi:MAG: hypothetical protein Q8S33_11895 [Myxococcales bacterium]|nr:hypothetical protein [Myxococcales bacterium]MDP3501034.1 hypothetical protein [Myxococcales bacterium]